MLKRFLKRLFALLIVLNPQDAMIGHFGRLDYPRCQDVVRCHYGGGLWKGFEPFCQDDDVLQGAAFNAGCGSVDRLKGFMMAPWFFTLPAWEKKNLEDFGRVDERVLPVAFVDAGVARQCVFVCPLICKMQNRG